MADDRDEQHDHDDQDDGHGHGGHGDGDGHGGSNHSDNSDSNHSDSDGESEEDRKMSRREFKFLKSNRKVIRAKCTKKCNEISLNIMDYLASDCQQDIALLNCYNNKLEKLNDQISKGIWLFVKEQNKLDDEIQKCIEYEENIASSIKFLEVRISNIQLMDRIPLENINKPESHPRLPEVSFPKFGNHESECLEQFFENFEDLISKTKYPDYAKFALLKESLNNEALTLVSSLQGSLRSYDIAKDLLFQAFGSPLKRKFDMIKKLANLKLEIGGDPYEFIGSMNVITQSFDTMKIDHKHVLQYFLWEALPKNLQTEIVHITNDTFPSLRDIQDHIFDAITRTGGWKRGDRGNSVVKADNVVHTYAANIQQNRSQISEQRADKSKNKIVCVLCNLNHKMFKCQQYKTAREKTQRLKSLKGCIRCGKLHQTSECSFVFKNLCTHCNGFHFSCLCLSNKNKGSNSEIVKGSTVIINNECSGPKPDSVVLPTLSAKLPNGKKIRILKDSGAQNNFIKQSLVENGNFKILKANTNITINGFNSSSKYCTNVVEVCLMFGKSKHTVSAYVIPSLNNNMYLPGLSNVVSKLSKKGYSLADNFMSSSSDKITNVDFVLGASSLHCLEEQNILFGKLNNSLMSITPFGVILHGDLNDINMNLDTLPNFDKLKLHNASSGYNDSSKKHQGKKCVAKSNNSCSQLTNCIANADSAVVYGENSSAADYDSCPDTLSFCCVVDDAGHLDESKLDKALNSQLINSRDDTFNESCINYHQYDENNDSEIWSDRDKQLVFNALDNMQTDSDGRIIVPILWNERTSDSLATNYFLARQILLSNLNKLKSSPNNLLMIDDVFTDQLDRGIISEIDNVDSFLATNKNASFLAHMAVIKSTSETTKCRNVFLSNVCEKFKDNRKAYSHNQAMYAGPTLNRTISTSLLQLRFDEKIALYDLEKAFLTLGLSPEDQERLCFLWFKNVREGDFSIVAYKSNRLPFGLRCSPTLLMLSLYYILMVDTESDSEDLAYLKKSMYNNLYMDNGAISGNSTEYMQWAYDQLPKIFGKYKFNVQQFVTNDKSLHEKIIGDKSVDNSTNTRSKLMGLIWDTDEDTIMTHKLYLNSDSNTKRSILSSIASNFDLFNYNGPILNRARIFMHKLQKRSDLSWDEVLSEDDIKEWKLISKSVNNSSEFAIKRFVGNRSDVYKIVVCTDSSKLMYGAVVYLYNENTKLLSFLFAKNRLVNRMLEDKTIPSLELQAVELGVETAITLYNELTGSNCILPIQITDIKVYTDSLVSMHWINSYANKIEKMNKVSVFVKNRLDKIVTHCDVHPIQLVHCAGKQNPADMISRSCSSKTLAKSNYFSGLPIDMIERIENSGIQYFNVPCDNVDKSTILQTVTVNTVSNPPQFLVNPDNYSSFNRLFKVYSNVVKFVNNIRRKIRYKYPNCGKPPIPDEQIGTKAVHLLMRHDQIKHYGNIVNYFNNPTENVKDIPSLVKQLNIFMKDEVLYVKSKMTQCGLDRDYPVLLSKHSTLAKLFIRDTHKRMAHAGIYSVLSEVRKFLYIPQIYSCAKKILNNCVTCARFNNRSIRINQNSYRNFRIKPSEVPFKYIFCDYIGPFHLKNLDRNTKGYIVIITCLWSRAINLVFCEDMSNRNFLRAFQEHVMTYGIPELCMSDLGSQLVSSSKIITQTLNEPEVVKSLNEMKVKITTFNQYVKGRSELGSLVESLVKQTKKLIYGAIGSNRLNVFDFLHIIKHTTFLCNRRPIAYKNTLRDAALSHEVPFAVTPEMLIKGREIETTSIIPMKNTDETKDPTWLLKDNSNDHIITSFRNLNKVRNKLKSLYSEVFLTGLIDEATKSKNLYKPVSHRRLKVGDIVLLKEEFTKPCYYLMGRVMETTSNDIGEVTSVKVLKGSTREIVSRHVTSLIYLFSPDDCSPVVSDSAPASKPITGNFEPRGGNSPKKRLAALRCKKRNEVLANMELV